MLDRHLFKLDNTDKHMKLGYGEENNNQENHTKNKR